MKNVSQFLQEVRVELSKVEWPTFSEFVRVAAMVAVVVTVLALFLGSVDRIISVIVKQIFIYGS